MLLAAAVCLGGSAALLSGCLLLWWRWEEVESNITIVGTLTLTGLL